MSAIATFTLLPLGSVDGLREACEEDFEDYLSEQGRELAGYDWSGYILATLLPYLEQKREINLMKSDLDDLSTHICEMRECTAFVLTNRHREDYLSKLDPHLYSESELRAYYEDFNETKFEDAGKAMLDGISLFRTNLAELDPQKFILLTIG